MKKSILILTLMVSISLAFLGCAKTEDIDTASSEESIIEESTTEECESTTEESTTTEEEKESETVESASESEASALNTATKAKTTTTKSGMWEYITGYKGDGYGPGNKIRTDFDYAKSDILFSVDNVQEIWDTRVVMVTASNGVSIKAITFDENVEDGNGNVVRNVAYLPICDGEGKDLEPNSPFMVACNEFRSISWDGQSQVSDFSASPDAVLPVTSFKRTSLDVNDASLQSFKVAMDKKRAQAQGKEYYDKSKYNIPNDQVDVFYDGIMEMDNVGNILWQFRYVGDHWELKIEQNPAEYQWAAIKNVLHYLSPDGDALYAAIYDDFYVASWDNPIEDIGSFWPVGSSFVMRDPSCEGQGYCLWQFK